jgi:hypothetical protein
MTTTIYVLILILIILYVIVIRTLIKKEKFTCEEIKESISEYPKSYNLDPLFNGKFKPECCPSPYSSSTGCLCNDINTTELIIVRGGNRIMC